MSGTTTQNCPAAGSATHGPEPVVGGGHSVVLGGLCQLAGPQSSVPQLCEVAGFVAVQKLSATVTLSERVQLTVLLWVPGVKIQPVPVQVV